MTDKSNKGGKNWFVRHKVLTVIGVILLLAIIGSAGSDKSKNTSTSSSKTNTTKTENKSQQTKIGQVANDGKFAFTVNGVQCDQTSVGTDQYLTKTPQGQFCLLNITVKNIGNEAQMLDASNQYLYNAQNQKFSADSQASFYANPSGSTFLQSINPGNTVTGIVVFDLPKGVTPLTAELHDSSLSGGVKVSLQ